MQKKTRTPCVGICSTTYGDEVCRGCKRFYFEVINWNKYDEDEKDAIWTRLESLKTQIIYSKIKKINSKKLSTKIAELDLKIKTDLNEYCQISALMSLLVFFPSKTIIYLSCFASFASFYLDPFPASSSSFYSFD